MERFALRVSVGGVAMVAGLWAAELGAPMSAPWYAGVALGVGGAVGLGADIWRQLTV